MSDDPLAGMMNIITLFVGIMMAFMIFLAVGSFVATDTETHTGTIEDIRYAPGGLFAASTTHVIFEDGYDILLKSNAELGFNIKDNVWIEITTYLTSGKKITDWEARA